MPKRSERIVWDGLTGPSNVPSVPSHAEIIDKNDVIVSLFKSGEEDAARLAITAKLKKLVIDIDDDILHIPTDNHNYKYWFPEQTEATGKDAWVLVEDLEQAQEVAAKTGAQILERDGKLWLVQFNRLPWQVVTDVLRSAHLVTVSTEKMKEIYGKYNPNTVVIPNAVDFDLYPSILKPGLNDGLVRLGLFGSNSHYRDWKTIAKVLKTLLDEFPNLRLCYNTWFRAKGAHGSSMDEQEQTLLYPDYFDKLGLREHPQCEVFSGVEIQDYWKWLDDKKVDIGLAPLCDSEFNKAKSNLKYLEFSALHIPGVYQDMEPYNADVKPGFNGFLAKDSADWLKCLRRLITDEALRKEMGDRAFADVKARYSQERIAKRYAKEIQKLLGEVTENEKDIHSISSSLVLARS
jgi:glycosyltransferase involved in cell wall biosynthesis